MDISRSAFEVLSSMITPAVLISASGMLVLSTSNRLSRVVDRTRVLAERVRTEAAKKEEFKEQIQWLMQRVVFLRTALMSQYLAIALFVATSISIGVVAALGWAYGWVPVAIELLGTVALLYASLLLIREARVAVASTLREMASVHEAVEKQE